MTPEHVAWAVALALVAHGLVGWLDLGAQAPRPECAAPYRIGTDAGWTVVGCGTGDEPPLAGAVGLLFGIPLDLNRASAQDLLALPGVGPARAEAIVAARADAPFCTVLGIERVRGIGPRTAQNIEGWVRADCDTQGSRE